MKLSELNILPNHPVHSIGPIWIDSKRYELGDDGDTLIETPEPIEERFQRLREVRSLKETVNSLVKLGQTAHHHREPS